MTEIYFLYTFMLVMALNLLASFIYLVGLNQLRASLRRAYQTYMEK
jgi:hypothetical protein